MAHAVFCIAETDFQAETIVNELKIGGFLERDISALLRDGTGNNDFARERSLRAQGGTFERAVREGVLGSAFGWLAGMDVLSIPGAGSFVAAGPILSALRAAAVGATVGGIAGALVGMGLPELEARRYEGKIRSGNILISVHADNPEEAGGVKEIFEACRAGDVAISGEPSSSPKRL